MTVRAGVVVATVALLVVGSLVAQGLRTADDQAEIRLVAAVAPQYSRVALLANVAGDVVLRARLDASGGVSSVRLVHDTPLVSQAAIDSARQWRFEVSGADKEVLLRFSFRILPRETPEEQRGSVFLPPFSVEVRDSIPEQPVNYTSGQGSTQ